MYYPVRPPFLLRWYYPQFTWRIDVNDPVVYLTFDDGPTPEVTEFVLNTLAKFNARASFFCIGKNVELHPEIFKRLTAEGHTTGNHTYNHFDGWKTSTAGYLDNVRKAAQRIPSKMFRPPYGKIRRSQATALMHDYRIVMWDVISYDFEQGVKPEKCLQNVTRFVRPGSVVVFHDSLKAFRNLAYALPRALETLRNQGYRFEALTPELNTR